MIATRRFDALQEPDPALPVRTPMRTATGFRLLFRGLAAAVTTGKSGTTLRLQREPDLGSEVCCESRHSRWMGSAFGNLGEPLEALAVAEVFGPAGCGGVERAVAGFGVDAVR